MDDTKEQLNKEALEQLKPELSQERQELQERQEGSRQEDVQKAREMVETMQVDDDAKAQAASMAQSLAGVEEQEKLAKLLALAKQKGVIFAVKTAQKMNDPYVLDLFHDKLVEGGYYKEFLK